MREKKTFVLSDTYEQAAGYARTNGISLLNLVHIDLNSSSGYDKLRGLETINVVKVGDCKNLTRRDEFFFRARRIEFVNPPNQAQEIRNESRRNDQHS